MQAWLTFFACAAVIAVAGPVLVRNGDAIASHLNLSRSAVGVLLLATATSLPELVTGISAVTIANAPDIAVANVLGGCVLNLAMLVVLEAMSRDRPIYTAVNTGHILTAGFGVVLLSFVGASLLWSKNSSAPSLFWIGASAPVIAAIYLVGMQATWTYERRTIPQEGLRHHDEIPPPGRAASRYGLAALAIAAAGVMLPGVTVQLAEQMGWGQTFAGSILTAAATSLPELLVSISAMRLGAIDMAVANILGSNMFNMMILAIDDVAYTKGPLLEAASPANAATAFSAIMMTGIVVIALLYRPETRFRGAIGWTGLTLASIYLMTSYVIYIAGT